MSKDQKITNSESVETVDKILDYCISTLKFWGYRNNWPINLICDSLLEAKKILKFYLEDKKILKFYLTGDTK